MTRIKNNLKAGMAGVLVLTFSLNVSAQRNRDGGYNGGQRQNTPRIERTQETITPNRERPVFNRPQQTVTQIQPKVEYNRPERTQQNFPNNNGGIRQNHNTRPYTPPVTQTTTTLPVRETPVNRPNFPSKETIRHEERRTTVQNTPAQTRPVIQQTTRENNTAFRGTNNSGNFRRTTPQYNFHTRNSSFGGRDYGYARGFGYNNYDRRRLYENRFYYSGAYHPHPYYYHPFTSPRWGIRINILPLGYYPFYVGPSRYYYYDGLFYQPYSGYYETIEPPLGAFVPVLPLGARATIINNENYYEHNGTYYQRVYDAPQPYEVVGVNGFLQTDLPPVTGSNDIISDESLSSVNTGPPSELSSLPDNFKTVTLNDITYYVSPSGEYYTKNIDNNGRITYTVTAVQGNGN